MNLSETIEHTFKENDLIQLVNKIRDIGDLIEYSDLKEEEVIESVNKLFGKIRRYKDEDVIENILNVCMNIMNAHHIFSGFDLDTLLQSLSDMSYESISYVLTFLSFSRDDKYIKVIEPFLEIHELQQDAKEALMEINYKKQQEEQWKEQHNS